MDGGFPYVQVDTSRRVWSQPCTSAQINPAPDLTLTLTLTLTSTLTPWGARGRHEVGRGSPAIHTSLMNFICTSETLVRTYVRTSIRVVHFNHSNAL